MKIYIQIPFIKQPKKEVFLFKTIKIEKVQVRDIWDNPKGFKTLDLLGQMSIAEFGSYFGWSLENLKTNKKSYNLPNKFVSCITCNDQDLEFAKIFFYLLIINTNHWNYITVKNEHIRQITLSSASKPFPRPMLYSLTNTRVNKIIQDFKKMDNKTKKRFNMASYLWFISLSREDNLDILRDSMSSIEVILETTGALNIAFSIYYYLSNRKSFSFLYKMFSLRNKYVLGNDIPKITKEDMYKLIQYNHSCLRKYSEGNQVENMNDMVDDFSGK